MKNLLFIITGLFIVNGLMNNAFTATVKQVDGVTYIHNTETPKFSQPTIELKEEWRIGGEDPGFVFNNPQGLDVDEEGRILVTDFLEYDVKIFSPTGKLEKKFGRKGNGPGEFHLIPAIVSLSKDKLLVIDCSIAEPRNRFNYFSYDGNLIGSEDILLNSEPPTKGKNKDEDFRIASMESRDIYNARLVDENLWLQVHYFNYTSKEYCRAIHLFDLHNKALREVYVRSQKDPYLDKEQKIDDRTRTEILWYVNKNNTLTVIPDLYDYRIYTYNNSGTLLKVTSRNFKSPLKSKYQYERDKRAAQADMKFWKKEKMKIKVLKINPIIKNDFDNTNGLFYDDKERLWVLTNESFEGKRQNTKEKIFNFSAFDVFDAQGEYLMRVPIKTSLKAGDFKYKNGFLYFFTGDNDGYMWLVKMRVVDKTK